MELTKNGDYVAEADKVVGQLKRNRSDRIILTTSKIRKMLSMTADIYNEAKLLPKQGKINNALRDRLQYLKIQIVYEYGRDTDRDAPVKDFIDKAKLLDLLGQVQDSNEKLQIFCHYMEALVAYHRYYGGSDK